MVLEISTSGNKSDHAEQTYEESSAEVLERAGIMKIEGFGNEKIDLIGHLESSVESSSTVKRTEDIFSSKWAPSSTLKSSIGNNKKREKMEFTTEISTRHKEGPVEKRVRTKAQTAESAEKEEPLDSWKEELLDSFMVTSDEGTKMQDIQETTTNSILVAKGEKEKSKWRKASAMEIQIGVSRNGR
ncbi:24860_t:CDS:2 [Gigaspora rosea]|nr:24860_t:CDS:2 [Gigaspora rosea]